MLSCPEAKGDLTKLFHCARGDFSKVVDASQRGFLFVCEKSVLFLSHVGLEYLRAMRYLTLSRMIPLSE